jgi:hypothetical protein
MGAKGCGIGHPIQNGIDIRVFADRLGPVFPWINWHSNRSSVRHKFPHLWRPVPGSEEWTYAVARAKYFWEQSEHRWFRMPPSALFVMYNEPEGQGDTPARAAAAVMRQWVDESGNAPFIGMKVLHNEVAHGLEWRNDYHAYGGPNPTVEAFDLYGYSGNNLVKYANEVHRAVRSGGFGNPNATIYLLEIGSWGPVGSWTPSRASLESCMDAAAALQSLAFPVVLWFSTRYALENGFWMQNNLVNADGTLTALGERWGQYIRRERPILPVYSSYWQELIAQHRQIADFEFNLPGLSYGPRTD